MLLLEMILTTFPKVKVGKIKEELDKQVPPSYTPPNRIPSHSCGGKSLETQVGWEAPAWQNYPTVRIDFGIHAGNGMGEA